MTSEDLTRYNLARADDTTLPYYVRGAVARAKRPVTHVAHLPGCYQLMTDKDTVAYVRNTDWLAS